MPIWIALPLSCWFGYLSLWPLAWLTIFLRIFLFFFVHHQEYRLRTPRGRQDFSKDLGVVLAKNPILNELMAMRMFPVQVTRYLCQKRTTKRK